MIAVVRSGVALTLKEVQHHALAFAFVGLWSAMMVPVAVSVSLANGGTSFAASATGLAYYYGPIVALLVVRRLVIQEYEDGTIRFLDALPAPAWLQFVVKCAVGWVATLGIGLGISLPVLAFATLRELVTVGWFAQLTLAIVLYLTGWLALTFAIAHTGRFRHWIWMSLFLLMGSTFEADWQLVTWHAALGLPADATRHEVPWSGFAITSAWTAGLGALAAFLATFRGGALPAAAFRSASTRERVIGTAWVLALEVVVEVWGEVGPGTLNGWENLEEARPGVLVVGEVGDWPAAARQALDDLEALAPLDPPTTLVLAADHAAPRAPPGPGVRGDRFDRDQVLVRVGGAPTVADRARLVDVVVDQRSAGLAVDVYDRGFAVDGLGLFLAEPEGDRRVAERRVALALRFGLEADDLRDWGALRARLGPDLAAGVGAIGLEVAARLGSRQRVGAWLGTWVLPVLPETTLAPLRLGRVGSDLAGVQAEVLFPAWWEALRAVPAERAEEVAHVEALAPTFSSADGLSPFDVGWSLSTPPRPGTELVVEPLDPLRGRPTRFEDSYRTLVVPAETLRGWTPTWVPATGSVWVHLRHWEPVIQGWIQSPRAELSR